jgi:hypothetical protein
MDSIWFRSQPAKVATAISDPSITVRVVRVVNGLTTENSKSETILRRCFRSASSVLQPLQLLHIPFRKQ